MRRTEAEATRSRLTERIGVATRLKYDGPNGYVVVIVGTSNEFKSPTQVTSYIRKRLNGEARQERLL